ncbi:peptidase S24/S26A/S26B/S26C [Phyllosticta citrichinensis]|uniref:Mitochondrial inner membrane protease subunit n=1 Tax=Phyllosticta citrichinensis TaxID=1130410 RepID=A0ABR1XKP5_9PEZI
MAPTSRWRGLKVGYYTVTSLALLLFVRDAVAEVTPVHGPSMAPTFSPAFHEAGRMDRVLFNRLIDPRFLRRGDVVSLWGPHKPEQLSIKRVVGLPGDLVVVGRRPKGRAGGEEQGLHWGKVRVPWNHVWVEGDNWRESVDSTTYGPVPMGLVNGRAEYILWPPSRLGKASNADSEYQTRSKAIPPKSKPTLPAEFLD